MQPAPFSGPLGNPPAASGPDPSAKVSRVDALLDAAEAVIVRDGIASLTLDAVAAEAKVSKGGLLHHFPSKDRLVEALVVRTANSIRTHNEDAYQSAREGPGRMARALVAANLRGMEDWCTTCQRSSAAAFSALAHNPSLIEPMRAAYVELHQRAADDGLPEGVSEAVVAAIDGLWLYWVLGLVPVDENMIVRVRKALEKILANAKPAPAARAPRTSSSTRKAASSGRSAKRPAGAKRK